MEYGLITRNVTDLRAEPKFRSERKSQLLYNEPVKIINKRAEYFNVVQNDGYNGWVNNRAIITVSKTDWLKLTQSHNRTVISSIIKTSARRNGNVPPFLFYGTKLITRSTDNRISMVRDANSNTFHVLSSGLDKIFNVQKNDLTGKLIVSEARRFLGTPYLWGGITPFGIDCSGLVQLIFKRFGIMLPRDSKDQKKAGQNISSESILPGDLLFFPGHVAIAMDKCRIIHSSLAEGGVAINSLKPDSIGFRKDLYESFLFARRMIK